MVTTSSSPTGAGGTTPGRSAPSGLRSALIGVVIAILLAAAAVAVVTRSDGGDASFETVAASQQIQQLQQGCRQWHQQSPSSELPAGWCDEMGAWMHAQNGAGHMMWADPQRMHDTCVAALDDRGRDLDRPTAACRDMVDWMARHPEQWMQGRTWPEWHGNGR